MFEFVFELTAHEQRLFEFLVLPRSREVKRRRATCARLLTFRFNVCEAAPHLKKCRTKDCTSTHFLAIHEGGLIENADYAEVAAGSEDIFPTGALTRSTSTATTLYSGHRVSSSHSLLVTTFTRCSGKWKVV